MEWLKNIVVIVAKLPIAGWIKPLWKFGLKEAVRLGGDLLQESVKNEVDRDLAAAPDKIKDVVNNETEALISIVGKLPIPDQFKLKIIAEIRIGIISLRDRLMVVSAGGSQGAVNQAVDIAFDTFQQRIVASIDML